MIKTNYNARVYSPVGQTTSDLATVGGGDGLTRENTTDPYSITQGTYAYGALMPEGTKMVPRVMAVPVGDIYTTNMINATADALKVGVDLKIGDNGILEVGAGAGGDADPTFRVVKVYTMPDLQPGVKIQRIA
jgi:hypothetical protein